MDMVGLAKMPRRKLSLRNPVGRVPALQTVIGRKLEKSKRLKLYASEQTEPTHIRMPVMMCMLERDPILLGLDLM